MNLTRTYCALFMNGLDWSPSNNVTYTRPVRGNPSICAAVTQRGPTNTSDLGGHPLEERKVPKKKWSQSGNLRLR